MTAFTKKIILGMCERTGVKFVDDGNCIHLECPDGYSFIAIDCTSTHSFIYGDGAYKKSEIYKELYEYICSGIKKTA